MKHSFRIAVIFLQALILSAGQTSAPAAQTEPPEQAQKFLQYGAQLDAEAKKARRAGQQRALADARTLPTRRRSDVPGEQLINERTTSSNGIYVDIPKVYDDALLQQMLNSAQGQLANLQAFDQSGLARAIGSVTGANQQIAGFGVTGGIQPPVTETEFGNVGSPFPPPSGNAPTPSTTLPATPSPSASDILDEQLQLTSQIANLRLLLEGSLSDQLMVGKDETFVKPRVTLGFPVVISPEKRYKDAVAIVEVLVETNGANDASPDGEPPSITALLPQEKTYNVASISDKSASIGLGIATATAGGAASFLWGHKQYFIVKDQDTLAMQFEPTNAEIALLSSQQPVPLDKRRLRAFAWQFRPVLGRPFVQAGVRQVFVQLAFPGRGLYPAVKSFGSVRIRTYWRRVDLKTGVLSWIIPDSLSETKVTPILNYDLHQSWGAVASFNRTDLEDLGDGKMLVKLDGQLLPGSYLRVGANIVQPGAAGAPSDLKTTRFAANISDLATLKTYVISRDGTEFPLKIPAGRGNQFQVDQKNVSVTTLDDATVLLRIPITNFDVNNDIKPVLLIAGKVFGYSDAPIDRHCDAAAGTCVLSVALPTGLLAANPFISVKDLMMDESGMTQSALAANRTFALHPQSDVPDKLVFVTSDATTATYLVYGHDLDQTRILWPARNVDTACPASQLCLEPLNSSAQDNSLKLLKLPADFVKEPASLVVQRTGANRVPFVLAVPAIPSEAPAAGTAATSAGPKFQQRVVVGSDEATLVGDKLDSIVSASFSGKPLSLSSKTAGSLKISGLAAAGATSIARTDDIVFVNQAGKPTKVPLEVVSSRVEVLSN